jgi:N-ethylmaleimide reductase
MTLFEPLQVGPFKIRNRLVLAPLVRARCGENRAPTSLVSTYYVQRASAGLLISEGTHVSPMSMTRPGSSAHYTGVQNVAWSNVVDAVHAADGIIFQQLYHAGRKAIASVMPGGVAPIAPSPIAAVGGILTEEGLQPFTLPRELELSEIPELIEEFRVSARRAYDAGFDGIEIQGGNGFLIDQFLRDGANKRRDAYGGSIHNRARFLLEVVDAVSGIFGWHRVGVRLSPHFRADGFGDSNALETFTYVAEVLNQRGIAFLHLIEGVERQTGPSVPLYQRLLDLKAPAGPVGNDEYFAPHLRQVFNGPLILNGSYTRDTAIEAVRNGTADAISFGRLFISNPDLPERFRLNAPLNPVDVSTFYTPGPKGYTDYPTLQNSSEGALYVAQG